MGTEAAEWVGGFRGRGDGGWGGWDRDEFAATGGANLRRRAVVPSANKGGRPDEVRTRRLHLAHINGP